MNAISSTYWMGTVLISVILLSACGSVDDDKESSLTSLLAVPSLTEPSNELLTVDITDGDNSAPADDIATDELQRSAAEGATRGISLNSAGFQLVSENAASSSNLANMTNALNDRTGGLFSDEATPSLSQRMNSATQKSEEIDNQTQQLLFASLGLDNSGNARATRTGNRINIDPDDAELCANDTFAMDVTYTSQKQDVCEQLMSLIIVQLDALTERSGTITYLFNQQAFLTIGYGPLNALYELQLDTLHEIQQLSNQLSPDESYTIQRMQGALRLTASANSESQQATSGTMALVVTEPLVIKEKDGSQLSMSPATLFTAVHDDVAGTARVELGWGAMELIMTNQLDQLASSVNKLTLGGFTGIFELTGNDSLLKASNLGFTNGPMRFSSSDGDVATISLDPFGFSMNTVIGEVLLKTGLAANISMSSASPASATAASSEYSFDVSLTAAAGTRLDTESEQSTNIVKAGGPLSLDYRISNTQSSESGFISLTPNHCQASSGTSNGAEEFFGAIFSCDSGMD